MEDQKMNKPDNLTEKYNVPVPRYTSYPPATEFNEMLKEDDYRILLDESNKGFPGHIALYFHIPFCRQICHYCGCNATPTGRGSLVMPYLKALQKEIEMVTSHLDTVRKVSQIHFGGGTPNTLEASALGEIVGKIRTGFEFIDDPEIAIECHPAYLDESYIMSLHAAGFNRFSLGIQDLDDGVLNNVNRALPAMPPEKIVDIIKKSGASVNLDFIYGLPGQNVASFGETIGRAIEMRPDRLVTFSYAHVPWMKKHQAILEKKGLPGPLEKAAMFRASHDKLITAGYVFAGLDHYVLPDDELAVALSEHTLHRNFQGYCTRRTTGQVYAFGISGISQLDGGYVQNTRNLKDYISLLESGRLPVDRGLRITLEQKEIREVINEVMCNKLVKWSEISERLKVSRSDLLKRFEKGLEKVKDFENDGLVTLTQDEIRVTAKGEPYIRNLAAALDPAFSSGINRYSKSV